MNEFESHEADEVQLISPLDLQQWTRQQDAPLVIDVRESEAHKADEQLLQQLSHQAEISNVPITEFGSHLNQLDPDQPIVLICQVGQKSFNAATLLVEADFSCVYSLHGGIEALKRTLYR